MKILYQSDFCTIINFLCECTDCAISKPEYQDRFSFCFIRKGNFLFKAFRNDLDSYTGRILINKPDYDYRIAHVHTVPDQCTIFSFSQAAFEQFSELYKENLNGFIREPDMQSILLKSTAAIDYLHFRIFNLLESGNFSPLNVECLLTELAERVFSINQTEKNFNRIPDKHKENYLSRIEKAKDFIQYNFPDKIGLNDIASECAMSPFHFARIFRRIAEVTPYQYLFDFRYSHAEHLLKNSDLPVSEISFLAGYNSPSHFSTVFKSKSKTRPTSYRSV